LNESELLDRRQGTIADKNPYAFSQVESRPSSYLRRQIPETSKQLLTRKNVADFYPHDTFTGLEAGTTAF